MRNSEQLPKITRCWIRNKTNIPIKLTLHIIERGTHRSFVHGLHLHFGTYLMTCLLNPGAYRQKNLRLSSAPLGLVMKKLAIYFFCHTNLDQIILDTRITIIFLTYVLKSLFFLPIFIKIKFENVLVYEHLLFFEINYIIVITVKNGPASQISRTLTKLFDFLKSSITQNLICDHLLQSPGSLKKAVWLCSGLIYARF